MFKANLATVLAKRWHVVAGCKIKASNVGWSRDTLYSSLDILHDRTLQHDSSRWSEAPLRCFAMQQCRQRSSLDSLVDLPPDQQLPRPVRPSRPKTRPGLH